MGQDPRKGPFGRMKGMKVLPTSKEKGPYRVQLPCSQARKALAGMAACGMVPGLPHGWGWGISEM